MRRFESKKNIHKFWAVEVKGNSLARWWGKVGALSNSKTIELQSPEESLWEEQKLIKEKIAEGYKQVSGPKFTEKDLKRPQRSKHSPKDQKRSVRLTGDKEMDRILEGVFKTVQKKGYAVTTPKGLDNEEIKKKISTLNKSIKKSKFDLPKSFKKFHATYNGMVIPEAKESFHIYPLSQLSSKTKQFVSVPKGTTWETTERKEVPITTDHLLAFASAGPESQWCFCVDKMVSNEFPIYYFNQDEPLASRIVGTNQFVQKKLKPNFTSFTAWFKWYAKEI